MKSDSLIKATASLLALSLLATTCFTTVSEAAGNKNGIISENPVTVSALMMQSLNSKTYEVMVAEDDKAGVASAKDGQQVGQDQEKTEQNEEAVKEKGKDTEAKAKTVETKKVDKKVVKKVSKYAKTGIAIEDVVNIREKANTTSTIVGRLYKGAAAKIVKEGKVWVYIKSGSVKGYIKKDLLAIGKAAEKVAPKYVTRYAVVNTVTLNVREKASTKASIVTQIGEEEAYKILKENAEWYQIKIDDETKGCITKEYVTVVEKFAKAVSMEEILAELEAEEEEEEDRVSSRKSSKKKTVKKTTKKSTSRRTTVKKSSKKKTTKRRSSGSSSVPSTNGKGIASYALQFVGNPYVYGGSSLTNGTDCSGFTKAIYAKYGKSIPRSSNAQLHGGGKRISRSSLQSGDLVFYGNGSRANHVAIYIGGGQIVHASNKRDGIKVSNMNYRTPIGYKRY